MKVAIQRYNEKARQGGHKKSGKLRAKSKAPPISSDHKPVLMALSPVADNEELANAALVDRGEVEEPIYVGTDTAVPEILLPGEKGPVSEKERLLDMLPEAPEGKLTSKKRKRLEKFIEKQLKKEERVKLIEKLQANAFSSELLKSSKDIGRKMTGREKLRQALKEERHGVPLSDPSVRLHVTRTEVTEDTCDDMIDDADDDDDADDHDDGRTKTPKVSMAIQPSSSVEGAEYVKNKAKVPEIIIPTGFGSGQRRKGLQPEVTPLLSGTQHGHAEFRSAIKTPLPVGFGAALKRKITSGVSEGAGTNPVAKSKNKKKSSDKVVDGDKKSFNEAFTKVDTNGVSDESDHEDGEVELTEESNGEGERFSELAKRKRAKRLLDISNKNDGLLETPASSSEDNLRSEDEDARNETSDAEDKDDSFKSVKGSENSLEETLHTGKPKKSIWTSDIVTGETSLSGIKSSIKPPSAVSSAQKYPTKPGEATFFVPVHRSPEIAMARINLPVVGEEQPIMEAILTHDVVIICGETGSGKTTQIPQFLYEAGFGDPRHPKFSGLIGITQPRRVAAVSMARRVGEEMSLTNGEVAFQIRYDSTTVKPGTRIKFMTDGILLRELSGATGTDP